MDLSTFILEYNMRRLHEYLDLVEKSILEKKKDWVRKVEEQAAEMDDDEKEEFLEYQADEHWAFTDEYPDILRKSVFIIGFNLLEHELINLCKRFKRTKNLGLDISEIRGAGITQAQVYLKKAVGIAFPDNSQLWEDIKIYQNIRNLIIHNDSSLKDGTGSSNIKDYISRTSNLLKLKNEKRIIFDKDFCVEALNTIETFLASVYSVIENNRGQRLVKSKL